MYLEAYKKKNSHLAFRYIKIENIPKQKITIKSLPKIRSIFLRFYTPYRFCFNNNKIITSKDLRNIFFFISSLAIANNQHKKKGFYAII